MTPGTEFAATLAEAKLGDEQAIGQLYRDAQPRLLAYFAARVPQAAEDLASDVWLAVAKGLPSFEGGEPEWWGYLFTIARRQVASHWRQANRRRTDTVEPAAFLDRQGTSDVEAEGIAAVANSEAVALIVANLSKEQAEVVLLRVIGGLDVEQVARILHKKPGTIRVLQHRAVRKLAAVVPGLAVIR
jgi:RNA polymerase sigma-70 factor (ECF subfamily)